MSAFPIEDGAGGAGTGSYDAGLLTLSDGRTRGVEDIARLTPRDDDPGKRPATQTIPGFFGSLRSALPAPGRLSMPARLAVSTVRAGLGVIEEGFAPDAAALRSIEIAFADGGTFIARMPPGLIATIRRDRDIALGAIARQGGSATAPPVAVPDDGATAEALTSIFRYEKRNGRLRRVAEPEPSAKE